MRQWSPANTRCFQLKYNHKSRGIMSVYPVEHWQLDYATL
jgi:hypothetical protein